MSASDLLAEDSLSLRPSLRQWWWILALSPVCLIAGIVMNREGQSLAWLMLLFAVAGALASIIALWPGASYLRLTREGFEQKTLWRRDFHCWTDVAAFRVAKIGSAPMVVWEWAPGVDRCLGTKAVVALTGAEAGLGDTYGLAPEELAHLLNTWRKRAAGEQRARAFCRDRASPSP